MSTNRRMYKYALLKDASQIEKTFIDTFIDVSQYNSFALTHANGFVHMFDFIKRSHKITYSAVVKYVENAVADKYYIMLNISQCYYKQDGRFQHNYKTAEISREDLLSMLNDQKKDMRGEELCCIDDLDRVYYWDMMIFNRTYKWCLAITHETDTNGARLCFIACSNRDFSILNTQLD